MYRKISNFDFLWEKTFDTLMKTMEPKSNVENFEKHWKAMVLYQTYGTFTV